MIKPLFWLKASSQQFNRCLGFNCSIWGIFFGGGHIKFWLQYFWSPLVQIHHIGRLVSICYDTSEALTGSTFSFPVFQWPDGEDLASSRWTGRHLRGDWQCWRGGQQLKGRHGLGYEWWCSCPALWLPTALHRSHSTATFQNTLFQLKIFNPDRKLKAALWFRIC